MQNKKYVVGLIAIVVLWSLSWLSTEALNINSSSFQTWDPVFKQILFKLLGDKTNPSEVILDSNGVYISTNALPTNNGSVYKRLADGSMTVEQVVNQDIVSGSISTIKIMDWTITNANIANININNNNFENSTLVITKFDPTIVWPTGANSYYTNNVCAGLTAITSITAWTASCTILPAWWTGTLPTCGNWEILVSNGTSWDCAVYGSGYGAGNWGDLYWTGTTISGPNWAIASTNTGKVGIWVTSPTQQLHVNGGTDILDIQGTSEDQVYCYANDTWVDMSVYNPAACAWCNPGYSYNPNTLLCEQNSCLGTWAIDGVCGSSDGQTFASAPSTYLCSAGNPSAVLSNTAVSPGEWLWSCNGINGWVTASCVAFMTWSWSGSGGSNIYITNRSNLSDTINDINNNGAQFFTVDQWTYPVGWGNDLAGTHGWLGADEMDYNISSAWQQCLYVFVNNPSDANAGGCNPSGYISQTQVPAAMSNGTLYAPAFASTDRIDIVMCGWICN